MSALDKLDSLKERLHELFQSGNNDLGFGIYRIMNVKRREISQYIENDIPKIVKDDAKKASNGTSAKEKEVEAEIYEGIYDFFSTYYDKGVIVHRGRGSNLEKKTIPPSCEEPRFQRANDDRYYIKTADTEGGGDHFIHKDLKQFLLKELDSFIKSVMLHVDDLTTSKDPDLILSRVRIFKEISSHIINVLAQVEGLQRRLWEKKKFVIATDYLITLDNVDEKQYPEILENAKQLESWRALFGFDPTTQPGSPIAALKQHPTLSIDTKFFPRDFKYRILEGIGDLDEKTTGILIKSDNFHALNLLMARYKGKIKCCYIDPPYNARSSEITYKNDYDQASWLNMIFNRLLLARDLLDKESGVLVVAIDENEQERLGLLLETTFPGYERTCVAVVHNAAGIQGKNFSYCHEYAYFVFPAGKQLIGTRSVGDAPVTPLRDWGKATALRTAAKTCFYPVIVKDGTITGFGDVCDRNFHPTGPNAIQEDGSIWVYPVDSNNVERKWRFSRNEVESIHDELFCKERDGEWVIYRKKVDFRYKTVWNDTKYYANVYGSKLLGDILGSKTFTFPKSPFLVKDCLHATTQNDPGATILDFFAGSGTTGHAVLKLNKDDNGNRKFILVESGDYFDSVLKPRIQKIIYSDNWSKGKPRDDQGSLKQIIKYQYLEQYDDALDNTKYDEPGGITKASGDQVIMYSLGSMDGNIALNFGVLDDPFACKLKAGRKEANVDLVETFNYVAGIIPRFVQCITSQKTEYIIIKGLRKDKRVVAIWRNVSAGFDLEKDKDFIENNILDEKYNEIFVNGKCLIDDVALMDDFFKNHMFDVL